MSDTPSPPAGWYPAPHANNEQRYWNGQQWLDWTPEQAAAAAAQPTVAAAAGAPLPAQTATATMVAEAPPKKKGLRWWAWLLIGLGALIVLIIIIGSINSAANRNAAFPEPPAAHSRDDDEEPAVEEPETVTVPDLSGLTLAEAAAELDKIGFTLDVGDDPSWVVTEQTLTGEVTVDELEALTLSAEPDLTLAQENAIGKAQSYLDLSGFSREGLIDQLIYEGFSKADSIFAADNAGADWKAEAAEKAQSYLDMTSFSRQGLYDQLAYEGFTKKQIEYALKEVGY